ncbi:MAG: glycosyl hydrolase family 8 [Flavobacteriaceae bacterium]
MKKIILLFAILLLYSVDAYSQYSAGISINYNNPNLAYKYGTIKPNVSQSTRKQNTIDFYVKWRNKYFKTHGDNEAYINMETDDWGYPNTTTSEAHGYGMMIMAYMGDSYRFNKLFTYYKNHRSSTDGNYLMSWKQSNGNILSNTLDGAVWAGTASDGDIDIAYALMLADKRWEGNQYLVYAKRIIKGIKLKQVSSSNTVLLGGWVNGPYASSAQKNATRPSDLVLDHFRAFQRVSGQWNIWKKIINKSKQVLYEASSNAGNTPLVSDFIVNATGSNPRNAIGEVLESYRDQLFYHNAVRVPWRIGTDYLTSSSWETHANYSKTFCNGINEFFKEKTDNDDGDGPLPQRLRFGYKPSTGYSWYNSTYWHSKMSLLGPLAVSAMVDSSNQVWLDRLYAKIVSKNIENSYFEDTIKMMCLIVLEGRYWTPHYSNHEHWAYKDNQQNQENIVIKKLNVYPNPVNSDANINISYPVKETTTIQVSIVNVLGAIVYKDTTELQPGKETFTIKNDFEQGMYLVKINNNGNINTTKLIIN